MAQGSSFALIYVLRTEVKDQFPLDHAGIVDKHSRVANLRHDCEVWTCLKVMD